MLESLCAALAKLPRCARLDVLADAFRREGDLLRAARLLQHADAQSRRKAGNSSSNAAPHRLGRLKDSKANAEICLLIFGDLSTRRRLRQVCPQAQPSTTKASRLTARNSRRSLKMGPIRDEGLMGIDIRCTGRGWSPFRWGGGSHGSCDSADFPTTFSHPHTTVTHPPR